MEKYLTMDNKTDILVIIRRSVKYVFFKISLIIFVVW